MLALPASGVGDLGFDWSGLVNWGQGLTSDILKAQYGQPNIQPGTYIQQGPQGSVTYRAPEGAGGFFTAAGGQVGANLGSSGVSTSTLIVGGAIVLAVVFMMNMGGRR